jgi:hypothetical protein
MNTDMAIFLHTSSHDLNILNTVLKNKFSPFGLKKIKGHESID